MFPRKARSPLLLVPLACALAPACSSESKTSSPPALEARARGETHAWSLDQLGELPTQEVTLDGTRFRGARLRSVIGNVPPDGSIIARGADGYAQTLSSAAAMREECLVAYARDGRTMAPPEGPLRIVLPGSPGLSVRNLVSLELTSAKSR